ncbi:putative pre-16S rRNA nuclease [Gammaproteobacteria bacterium]
MALSRASGEWRASVNKSSHTIVGFDFGLRRIGVAVGQTLTGTASPLQTLRCIDGNPDWHIISRIIAEWCPIAIVVGLPLTADGTKTTLFGAVQLFIRHLEGRYRLPVHTIDEHLSSHEAETRLMIPEYPVARRTRAKKVRFSKEAIDRVAAQVILQTWLAEQAHDYNGR